MRSSVHEFGFFGNKTSNSPTCPYTLIMTIKSLSKLVPDILQQPSIGVSSPPRLLEIKNESDLAALLKLVTAYPTVVMVFEPGLPVEDVLVQTTDLVVPDTYTAKSSLLHMSNRISAAESGGPVVKETAPVSAQDSAQRVDDGEKDAPRNPTHMHESQASFGPMVHRADDFSYLPPSGHTDINDEIHVGALSFNRLQRRATLAGKDLALTPREWGLLAFFLAHPGCVFSRGDLLDQVWGYGHDGYEHTVNSHINRLRSKLGEQRGAARFIHTVWGSGYRFEMNYPAPRGGVSNESTPNTLAASGGELDPKRLKDKSQCAAVLQ